KGNPMNPQQPVPRDQGFATALPAILAAAIHWDRLHLRPGEQVAELSNWLFEENRVAGNPGVVQIREPTPEKPGPFVFVNCTFRRSDAVELADVIIDLINDALAR